MPLGVIAGIGVVCFLLGCALGATWVLVKLAGSAGTVC